MENVYKCVFCFCAQILALYTYWHFFFGHANFFHLFSTSSRIIDTKSSELEVSAIFITCPSDSVAKTLSYGLVEKKLAACVNIIPKVLSIYHWNGSVQEDSEVLMMVKTKKSYVSQIIQYMKKGHPYDVPEVISLTIQEGNKDYLEWIRNYIESD